MQDDEQDEVETIADGRCDGQFVRTFWSWHGGQPDQIVGWARVAGETYDFEYETDYLLPWVRAQTSHEIAVLIGPHTVTMPKPYLEVMADQIGSLR